MFSIIHYKNYFESIIGLTLGSLIPQCWTGIYSTVLHGKVINNRMVREKKDDKPFTDDPEHQDFVKKLLIPQID